MFLGSGYCHDTGTSAQCVCPDMKEGKPVAFGTCRKTFNLHRWCLHPFTLCVVFVTLWPMVLNVKFQQNMETLSQRI